MAKEPWSPMTDIELLQHSTVEVEGRPKLTLDVYREERPGRFAIVAFVLVPRAAYVMNFVTDEMLHNMADPRDAWDIALELMRMRSYQVFGTYVKFTIPEGGGVPLQIAWDDTTNSELPNK